MILRLEDFGLELKRDAVSYIIEFVYRGEVNIPGERLTDVCQVEILPSVSSGTLNIMAGFLPIL